MASFKFNGMIPDDDPRYQEGITIMIGLGLNEKSKQKSGKNKEMELEEYTSDATLKTVLNKRKLNDRI